MTDSCAIESVSSSLQALYDDPSSCLPHNELRPFSNMPSCTDHEVYAEVHGSSYVASQGSTLSSPASFEMPTPPPGMALGFGGPMPNPTTTSASSSSSAAGFGQFDPAFSSLLFGPGAGASPGPGGPFSFAPAVTSSSSASSPPHELNPEVTRGFYNADPSRPGEKASASYYLASDANFGRETGQPTTTLWTSRP